MPAALTLHTVTHVIRPALEAAGVGAELLNRYDAHLERARELRAAVLNADELAPTDKTAELIDALRTGSTTPEKAAAQLAKQATAGPVAEALRAALEAAAVGCEYDALAAVRAGAPAALAETVEQIDTLVDRTDHATHVHPDDAEHYARLADVVRALEFHGLARRGPATDPGTETRLQATAQRQREAATRAAADERLRRRAEASQRNAELIREHQSRGAAARLEQARRDRLDATLDARDEAQRAAGRR
jgi:hypothetical protein